MFADSIHPKAVIYKTHLFAPVLLFALAIAAIHKKKSNEDGSSLNSSPKCSLHLPSSLTDCVH